MDTLSSSIAAVDLDDRKSSENPDHVESQTTRAIELSRFLSIPLELRQLIFEAFSGKPCVKVRRVFKMGRGLLSFYNEDGGPMMPMILLNRQIKDEFTKWYSEQCHVKMYDLANFARFLSYEEGIEFFVTQHSTKVTLNLNKGSEWDMVNPEDLGDDIEWSEHFERYSDSLTRFLLRAKDLGLNRFTININNIRVSGSRVYDERILKLPRIWGRDDRMPRVIRPSDGTLDDWGIRIPKLVENIPVGMKVDGVFKVNVYGKHSSLHFKYRQEEQGLVHMGSWRE